MISLARKILGDEAFLSEFRAAQNDVQEQKSIDVELSNDTLMTKNLLHLRLIWHQDAALQAITITKQLQNMPFSRTCLMIKVIAKDLQSHDSGSWLALSRPLPHLCPISVRDASSSGERRDLGHYIFWLGTTDNSWPIEYSHLRYPSG